MSQEVTDFELKPGRKVSVKVHFLNGEQKEFSGLKDMIFVHQGKEEMLFLEYESKVSFIVLRNVEYYSIEGVEK
jgi:hypothetical protein